MTLASAIVRQAYREANTTDIGADPTADEQVEALTLLQGVVDSFFGLVVCVRTFPWYLPAVQRNSTRPAEYPLQSTTDPQYLLPDHPPGNVRLVARVETETRVYLQSYAPDGALFQYVDVGHTADVVLDANGAFFGASGVNDEIVIGALYPAGRNAPRQWVFRADIGGWVEILPLSLTSDLPFPSAFDDYFVTALTMRLAPRFGPSVSPLTLERNRTMIQHIRAHWPQTKPVLVGNMGVPTLHTYTAPGLADGFSTGGGF